MEEQRKVGLQECRHLQVVAEPVGLLDSVRSRLEIFGGGDQISNLALGAVGGKGGIYNAPAVLCGSESSIRSFMVVCRLM